MNITYRQVYKISIVFLIFFFSTFFLYGNTSAKASPEKKLAVIIETQEDPGNETLLHSDIALSVKKFLEFKLLKHKVGADIYLIPNNTYLPFLKTLERSHYYGVLVLNFTSLQNENKQSFQRRVFKKQSPKNLISFSSTYSEIKGTKTEKIFQDNFVVHSRSEWFEPVDANKTYTKELLKKPEPVEYLIQRAVDSLLIDLPLHSLIFAGPEKAITAALFIDSSFIDFTDESWLKKYDDMMLYSSHILNQQFSHGIDVKSLVTANIRKDQSISMHQLFRRLKQNGLDIKERLHIYLINNNDREDYFLSNSYDNIGLAEIGRNQILINEIPSPTTRQTDWQAMYNGLTLIHEIGHAFGAIHVSDKYSIMNHSLTWLATNEFDPVNKQIIKDALDGKLIFRKKEDYLHYVTNLILASEYYLVDIPSFYYNFFKRKSDSLLFQSFSKTEVFKPFLYAASGYGYMEGRNYKLAEVELLKALEYLPTQASLYYYLSLCTKGEKSMSYLEKAYQMGYYLAEVDYLKLKR